MSLQNTSFGSSSFRDWSLITGRGGTKQEGGGACDVLPLRKKGGEGQNSFSHAEGGGGAQHVLG